MTKIDWRTLKLFDLCKVRVRILMKERTVLPTLIEVLDGGWVFTISIAVVGVEDVRRGREMSESTREDFKPHSWTGGGRRVKGARSTAKGISFVRATGRMMKGGERKKTEAIPMGTHGKRTSEVGNSWFQPSSSSILNSNNQSLGPTGSKQDDEVRAEGNKAYSIDEEGHWASNSKQERRGQPPLNPSPLVEENLGWERGVKLNGPLSKLGQEIRGKKPIF